MRIAYRLSVVIFLSLFGIISPVAAGEIEMPMGSDLDPIAVQAPSAQRWQQGSYDVWQLSGGVKITQGSHVTTSRDAVLWVDRVPPGGGQPSKIIAYLENDVVIEQQRGGENHRHTQLATQAYTDKSWFGRLYTHREINFDVPRVEAKAAGAESAVLSRALAQREPKTQIIDKHVAPTQYSTPLLGGAASAEGLQNLRRVRLFPRSEAPAQARWFPLPQRNERVAVVESGVRIIIDGSAEIGTIDLETDRIVIWTSEGAMADFSGENREEKDVPLEFYMEGNIIFRQGDRVIYADRMYYNVSQEYGVVMNAEVLTPIPGNQGLVRLKAEVLQQIDKQHFQAYGAAVTTSRLGVPRYWLQSQRVEFSDNQRTAIDPFTGQPAIDSATGAPAVEHDMLATSNNNFVFAGGVPIFYWPTIATDLEQPTYYIQKIKYAQDSVYGSQIYLDFNAYQMLGIRNPPPGTKWNISTDYLSERGPALGTNFGYQVPDLFGWGPAGGTLDLYGIYDTGFDNLGADRPALTHDSEFRGRLLGQHRHQLPNGWQFTAQAGFLSDGNFLESFFDNEWDQYSDQITGVELKRYDGSMSYGISANVRVNEFFTQTQQLPRLDHYWLGQDVFNTLTYYSHTHASYADLRLASTPFDPVDAAKFSPLAWEYAREGIRAGTRQEIDYPVTLGPVKVVPYALGEAAHWGETINEDNVTRLFGQVGVRTSMPIWTVDRSVQSELLNLNGLAHKIVLDADFFYADANEDMTEFPLYDQLDDDSIEHFRRRLYFNTYGGVAGGHVAPQFDERYFALRSGLQGNVTSPSMEIADDLMIARFGVRQRWQTKRGLPGRERIIDWITLDVQASFFPDPIRDNFGEDFGLLDYDFKWHLGDRFSIVSDGYADLFPGGLQTASVGAIVTRPELGSLYVGYRAIDGPFQSSIVNTAVNYRMSEKWIVTAGSSFDLDAVGNIGQVVGVTRIGESFLIRLGFNYDVSRDNLGFQVSIEPRAFARAAIGSVGGAMIPPAGALGLE